MHLRDKLQGGTRLWNVPDAGAGAAAPATPTVPDVPTTPTVPDPDPAGVATTPTTPAVAAPKPDWKDGRIGELTAKSNKKQEEIDRLTAELEQLRKPGATPSAGESEASIQARIDAEASRRAGEIAAQVEWNNKCNAVNDQGLKEFPDFADRLAAVKSAVNLADPAEFAQFNAVVAAAIETGQAHKVLHELGADAGEMRKLMSLPPLKVAMEIASRAAKLGVAPAAPDPSGAPKPIDPIGSRGNHYDGLDPRTTNGAKLPIAQWMKQREKQAEEAGIQ